LRDLAGALADRQAIPIGLELRDRVRLAPEVDARFATADVRGVYAVADSHAARNRR
jgi:hypothetical protein